MSPLFCCNNIQPHKGRAVDHEPKFSSFMTWRQSSDADTSPQAEEVNFGLLESKRYFAVDKDGAAGHTFVEISEQELIGANYSKVNSYKNFKCTAHNKYFELNLYQRNPVSKHHWQADIARPAGAIDLSAD